MKSVDLELLGQKITLKVQGDPETIREAVEIASLRLRDVEKRAAGAPAHKVALVALLDLAEEYVRAKRRTQDHKKRVEKRTADLLKTLDQPLK